jgi:hypothetical protein
MFFPCPLDRQRDRHEPDAFAESRFLAKYIVEVLGSIFARKDLVTHGSTLFHDCQAVATILSLLRCDPQASSIRPCGF